MKVLRAPTAEQLWRSAVEAINDERIAYKHTGRGGETREILHVGLTLDNPRQRWIFSRQPALNVAFALAEVVWIMQGRNDAAFLTFWNSRLPRFAGYGETFHGAYGHRLIHHLNVDQLHRAYLALQKNPDTRQVVLQIWDSRIDLPAEDGSPISSDVPCNVASLLKVREGKLQWMQIIRSNDLFLGLPHNIVQFTCLQEILAGWLGLSLGSYNQMSDSLHVYTHDLRNVNLPSQMLDISNEDSLAFRKEECQAGFAELERRMLAVMSLELCERELMQLANWQHGPVALQNIMSILMAEAARRRGWTDARELAEESCSNPALVRLWRNWLCRVGDSNTHFGMDAGPKRFAETNLCVDD